MSRWRIQGLLRRLSRSRKLLAARVPHRPALDPPGGPLPCGPHLSAADVADRARAVGVRLRRGRRLVSVFDRRVSLGAPRHGAAVRRQGPPRASMADMLPSSPDLLDAAATTS